MASFIKDENTISEQQYKKSYNNQDYIFIISSITNTDSGRSYLISYMPNRQDNGLLYTVLIIGWFL